MAEGNVEYPFTLIHTTTTPPHTHHTTNPTISSPNEPVPPNQKHIIPNPYRKHVHPTYNLPNRPSYTNSLGLRKPQACFGKPFESFGSRII